MVRLPMPDDLKVQLQQLILPLWAKREDGQWNPIGTAFVISANKREAIVMTAAHVIREAMRLERPRPRHAPSALHEFTIKAVNEVFLKRTRIFVHYRERLEAGCMVEVSHSVFSDSADLAVGIAKFGDDMPADLSFKKKLAINASMPTIGTPIISAGYGDTRFTGERLDEANGEEKVEAELPFDFRYGSIIDVFPQGVPGLNPWPSFQVDVPISSGMSGGPVINRSSSEWVVCGINVTDADLGQEAAVNNRTGSGERAICAALWPALPLELKPDLERPGIRLIELARRGWIDERGDAITHLRGVPDAGATEFWTSPEISEYQLKLL